MGLTTLLALSPGPTNTIGLAVWHFATSSVYWTFPERYGRTSNALYKV